MTLRAQLSYIWCRLFHQDDYWTKLSRQVRNRRITTWIVEEYYCARCKQARVIPSVVIHTWRL